MALLMEQLYYTWTFSIVYFQCFDYKKTNSFNEYNLLHKVRIFKKKIRKDLMEKVMSFISYQFAIDRNCVSQQFNATHVLYQKDIPD